MKERRILIYMGSLDGVRKWRVDMIDRDPIPGIEVVEFGMRLW